MSTRNQATNRMAVRDFGKCANFNGSNSKITISHNDIFNFSDAFTVIFWVKMLEDGRLQTFLGHSAYTNDGIRFYRDGSNYIISDVQNEAGDAGALTAFSTYGTKVLGSDILKDKRWHQLAFTYGRYNHRIFLDNKEIRGYIGNPDYDQLQNMADAFSDEDGNRAYPWGFEPQTGNMLHYFDGDNIARMVGDSEDDNTLFAIPDLTLNKPKVVAGKSYTQSFLIKKTGVSGNGVRLMHQWFDTTVPASMPFQSDYGTYENGTDDDWKEISYTITAPATAIRGDIVVQFHGVGTVQIKRPRYYLTDEAERLIKSSVQPVLIGCTTDDNWFLKGCLDNMVFFNQEFTKDQILDNYYHNKEAVAAIAKYLLDDNANDAIGENDGTPANISYKEDVAFKPREVI